MSDIKLESGKAIREYSAAELDELIKKCNQQIEINQNRVDAEKAKRDSYQAIKDQLGG